MTTALATRRPRSPLRMSEADLLAVVIELAQRLGWLVAHQRPAMTRRGWRTAIQGDAGFPDLILVRGATDRLPSSLLAVELKSDRGKTTAEQDEWLRVLGICGARSMVWRPSDWASGEIERWLR